jgi:hypothetical protein
MAQQVEAVAHKTKKELDHMRIHKAKNGGHVVEHHHRHFAHPPETHVFGPHEGGKLLAHIGKHMGVAHAEEEANEEEHEG